MSHFFITCLCTLSYCCSFIPLNDYCLTCHQFLGTSSIFTKTPMFSKNIGGHNCYLQREEQTTKYSPGLKKLLFSNKIYKYKEIASLLTLFTEHRLDSDNSNFVFNRIFKILISLEAGHITHYDNLFCELFLHRY